MNDITLTRLSGLDEAPPVISRELSDELADTYPSNSYTATGSTAVAQRILETPLAAAVPTVNMQANYAPSSSSTSSIPANVFIPSNDYTKGARLAMQGTAVPQLLGNYEDRRDYQRWMYRELLRIVYHQSKKAFEEISDAALLAGSADHDETLRIQPSIIRLLELVGEPALIAVKSLLNHAPEDSSIHTFLFSCLARVSDRETEALRISLIEEGAHSSLPQIRFAACAALGEMGTRAAKEAIRLALEDEENREVRRVALDHLGG
jgi:hypothetical protein